MVLQLLKVLQLRLEASIKLYKSMYFKPYLVFAIFKILLIAFRS